MCQGRWLFNGRDYICVKLRDEYIKMDRDGERETRVIDEGDSLGIITVHVCIDIY